MCYPVRYQRERVFLLNARGHYDLFPSGVTS